MREENVRIRFAREEDFAVLLERDRHIGEKELRCAVARHRVLVAEVQGIFAGWLRYNLFWDNTPFLNLLYVAEACRGRGIGRALLTSWEERMREEGWTDVMASTVAEEQGQHFFYRCGYRAIGMFRRAQEPGEIVLQKVF